MIKRIKESYKILQKGGEKIATYGSGSTNGKYIRINTGVERTSMNNYRLIVNLSSSSSQVYNGYGIKVYGHIGGTKYHLGTITISSGVISTPQFIKTFSVSSNTSVYASCICSYCESGAHNEYYNEFSNQTSVDTATYENPNSAPPAPRLICHNPWMNGDRYIGEGTLTVELSAVSDPQGDPVSYRIYGWYSTGSGWQSFYSGGNTLVSTDKAKTLDITGFSRGTRFKFNGRALDNKDAWSPESNTIDMIFRNNLPTTPTVNIGNTTWLNNSSVAENTINVSLSNCSDPEGGSVSYVIYGQKYVNGSWHNLGTNGVIVWGQSTSVNISGDPRGTRYKFWGHSYDNLDAWSNQSGIVDNVYRNQQPGTPSLSCSNTVLSGNYITETNVEVSLSTVSDPEGSSVSYHMYGQYATPGNGWTSLGDGNSYLGQIKSKSIATGSHPRGTRYKFWGFASDNFGTWSGQSNVIENIYRNQQPGTPSLYCNNTLINNRYVAEDAVVVGLHGVSDPEGSGVNYHMYGQYAPPGQGWISLGDGNSYLGQISSKTIQVQSHPRGTRYKFWGYSSDNFNVWSGQSNVIENIYRNQHPNNITTINPGTGIITGNVINLSWNNPGDPDGQTVKFNVEVSINDGAYTNIASNTTNTSISYNIQSHSKGTKYRFKITPYDGEAYGNSSESAIYRKDFPVIHINPINNCTLYQKEPRIIFTRVDNNSLYTVMSCNGILYNSRDNANLFTTSGTTHNGEKCYVFKGLLNIGNNNISIYNTDGSFNSSSVNIVITIENIVERMHIINPDIFHSMNTKVNICRQAYNQSVHTFSTLNKDSVIKLSDSIPHIPPLIVGIRDYINQYDSNKISSEFNSVNIDSIITSKDIEQIITAMTNL